MLVDLGMLVGGFNCSSRNILRGRMGEAHNYKDLQFLFVGELIRYISILNKPLVAHFMSPLVISY